MNPVTRGVWKLYACVMKSIIVAVTCYTVILQVQVIASDFERRPCPELNLTNGQVRLRGRGRVARFKCNPTYQIVGSKISTCIRSTWDTDPPFCIKNECPQISKNVSNGYWIEAFKGASYTLVCDVGYKLHGARVIYCYNKGWSAELPFCEEIYTSCDFEREDLCGWTQDMHHNFNWTRHSYSTPSSPVGTGPSYDHTLGPGNNGHYMYTEASSQIENDTARILSPVYEPQLSEQACFTFWYHMYGATIGDLNVYQKLQTSDISDMTRIFHKSGEQGNQWFMGIANLTTMNQQFQIVIEALRGRSYVSDIAIDDVKLAKGEECFNVTTKAMSRPTTQITVTSLPLMTAEPAILIPKTARAYPTFLPPPPPPPLPPFPPLLPVSPSTAYSVITSTRYNMETASKYSTQSPVQTTQETIQQTINLPSITLPTRKSYSTIVTHSFNTSKSGNSTVYLHTTPTPFYKYFTKTNNASYQSTLLTKKVYNPTTNLPNLATKNMVSTRHDGFDQIPLSTEIPKFPKYFTTKSTPTHIYFPIKTLPPPNDNTRSNILIPTYSANPPTNDSARHSTMIHVYIPTQRFTTLKNVNISPGKRGNITTVEPSTLLKEAKAEANASNLPSIAGAAGGIACVAIVAALLVFIFSRRITRFKKQRDMSEDSDVRFLTSDEVLDFTLARPSDDDL